MSVMIQTRIIFFFVETLLTICEWKKKKNKTKQEKEWKLIWSEKKNNNERTATTSRIIRALLTVLCGDFLLAIRTICIEIGKFSFFFSLFLLFFFFFLSFQHLIQNVQIVRENSFIILLYHSITAFPYFLFSTVKFKALYGSL